MKKDGRKSDNYSKQAPFTAAQRTSMGYGNRGQPVPPPSRAPKNPLARAVQSMADADTRRRNAEALGMGDVGKKIEGAAARDRQKTKLQQRSRWPGEQNARLPNEKKAR